MFCRLSPMSTYLVYFCCGWSSLQHSEQTLKVRSGSLRKYFDTAIAQVAYTTAETKGEGSIYNEIAVPNALNPSIYIGMYLLNVIGFALACHQLPTSKHFPFIPVASQLYSLTLTSH